MGVLLAVDTSEGIDLQALQLLLQLFPSAEQLADEGVGVISQGLFGDIEQLYLLIAGVFEEAGAEFNTAGVVPDMVPYGLADVTGVMTKTRVQCTPSADEATAIWTNLRTRSLVDTTHLQVLYP